MHQKSKINTFPFEIRFRNAWLKPIRRQLTILSKNEKKINKKPFYKETHRYTKVQLAIQSNWFVRNNKKKLKKLFVFWLDLTIGRFLFRFDTFFSFILLFLLKMHAVFDTKHVQWLCLEPFLSILLQFKHEPFLKNPFS